MDERIHASFTAAPAHIEDREGTRFRLFDDYIVGENVVLEKGKKIVQKWRAVESNWPDTHYSEVVYIFTPQADGCLLDFYHNEIPEALFDQITKGWEENYWEPLKFYLLR